MKKIIFGILSLLLITPVFAYQEGNYYFSNIFSVSSSSGVSNYYSIQNQGRCVQGKQSFTAFGLGRYNINNSFDFIDSGGNIIDFNYSLLCNYNSANYLYVSGYNNGYYVNSSGNNVFLGNLFGRHNRYGDNYHTPYGSFRLGLNSFSVFNGNIDFIYSNFSDYYSIKNTSSNSSTTIINTPYLIYYYDYNLYNYWDSNYLYTSLGSYKDVSSGCSRLGYTPIFYDGGYTFSYNCDGNIKFKTIAGSDINYTFYDEFSSVDVFDKNRDYLFLHFNNYSSDYLSGKLTIILQDTSSGVVYNIYPYVSSVNQLSGVNLLRKGYLSFESLFGYSLSELFSNSTYFNNSYFEVFGSYNAGINFRVYNLYTYVSNSSTNVISRTFNFNFIEDDSVPKINLDGDKGFSSLTTGSAVDILDTLCKSSLIKPAFCNGVTEISTGVDGFWDLDGSGNIVFTLINTDPDNMGWADITSNGSGGFNIICSDQDGFGCPLLENAGLSGYLDYGSGFILGTDYYETFFQKTGRFFACPYGYVVLDTNSFLKILNKFNQISESIGFDFMLPINCSIAAFTHGKNYKFLKDVDLGLNPLMGQIQGPDDPRVYLYRFFDFLMSIALLFFLLKLYHLIF